jgi:hypothetical protein
LDDSRAKPQPLWAPWTLWAYAVLSISYFVWVPDPKWLRGAKKGITGPICSIAVRSPTRHVRIVSSLLLCPGGWSPDNARLSHLPRTSQNCRRSDPAYRRQGCRDPRVTSPARGPPSPERQTPPPAAGPANPHRPESTASARPMALLCGAARDRCSPGIASW